MNYRLVNSEEKLVTLASRPDFLSTNVFTENLVGVRLCKSKVTLDKPMYIGQAVLELSKLEMYELRYVHLPRYEHEFGGKIRVAGGDTDSFFLRVDGIRVERDLLPKMQQDGLLDSSNYDSNHPLYSVTCKAKLGCIKDEAEGLPFKEWVLLKPKQYSMKLASGKEKKRAKGVRTHTLSAEIRHEDYLRTIKNCVEMKHTQRRIGSKRHQNYTLQYVKSTLSFFEDKRAWVNVEQSTAYGNHHITSSRRPPTKKSLSTAPQLMEVD